MNKYITTLLLVLIFSSTFAQKVEQPEHEKKYYRDNTGKLFAPCSLPAYISMSSQPNNQGISTSLQPNTGSEMYLSEGKNTICNDVALKTQNGTQKISQCYDIYGDNTPPESQILFENANFHKTKNAFYYGQKLTVKIEATDELSGWNSAYISQNETDYVAANSFPQIFENGKQNITYYSTDNVGNVEKAKEIEFFVDLLPPKTRLSINGIYKDSTLSPEAKIVLAANDELSGVENTYYTIDNQKEKKYSKPIDLSELEAGTHTITYYSTDYVKNKEEAKTWEFIYDTSLPTSVVTISGNVYIKDNTFFVSSQPEISITAKDSLSEISRIEYELNTDPRVKYEKEFTLENRAGLHRVSVFCYDIVENRSKKSTATIYLDNSAPKTYYQTTKSSFWNSDTLIISEETGIVLKTTDMEAGIKETFYSLNDQQELTYTDTLFLETGQVHKLSFYSVDNVDNKEEAGNLLVRVENQKQKIATTEKHAKNWIFDDNKLIGSTDLPFYIKISDSPDPDAKSYTVLTDNGEPLVFNNHGVNDLKIKNSFTNQQFKIDIDGVAPKTTAKFSGANKFTKGKTIYYGANLKLELTATDNKKPSSGLESILYSINGSEFGKYSNELKVFNQEQKYIVNYYAIDSVKNQEKNQVDSFIIDITPPLTFAEFDKNSFGNILSNNSKILLNSSDNLSGVENIYYYFDDQTEHKLYRNKIYSADFTKLNEGDHTLYFYAIDKVKNKERTQSLPLIIDKNPPELKLITHGAKHTKGSTIYLSRYSKVSLQAEEKTTEVKNIKYNINGGKTEEYKNQKISFPEKNGMYYFNYFSEDKVANINRESQQIYIDTEAPSSSISYVGETFEPAGKIIVSSKTKFKISSNDNASGVSKIYYNSGAGTRQYNQPFSVNGNGNKKITYYAVDNVANREEKKSLEIIADNTLPEIKIVITPNAEELIENVYTITPYSLVHISATDQAAGIKGIFYTINDGEKIVYRKPISGFERNHAFRIKIMAYDRVGNSVEKTIFLKVE